MLIGVMGESGSGKTTAMRTLDPETTFYIDADKKGLSWKGWRQQYITGKNYYRSDNPYNISYMLYCLNGDEKMRNAWCKANQKQYAPLSDEKKEEMLSYKTVVIDTMNGIMVGEEMRRMKEKGYDKWSDLASFVYDIIDYCLLMRVDLTTILVFHCETIQDDLGNRFTRIKTNGRKLEKIVLESKLPVLLWATGYVGEYKLLTRANDCTCKAPIGAFEADAIPNDMRAVLEALADF